MARSISDRRGRRRAPGGARALALVLLCGALATAGCGAASEPATEPPPPSTSTPQEPESGPPPEAAAQTLEPVDASLDGVVAAAAADAAAAPATVSYERFDWSMPVDPVGIADDGQMAVPEDALRAGWYSFGPGAGAEAGVTVLAAHAGSYVTPRGPFHDLTRSEPGDVVVVERADGVVVGYEVTAVEQIEKAVIDLRPYFERSGPPRLVLITCGGVWDDERQSYRSNVVVTAVPVS